MTSAPFVGQLGLAVIAPFVRRNCSDVRPSPWTTPSTYGASVSRLGADHPAGLAVRLDPLPQKLHAGLQDEVACHPLPHEVELVALRPHVHAAGREAVFLRHRVVDRRSGNLGPADVFMAVEGTQRSAPRPSVAANPLMVAIATIALTIVSPRRFPIDTLRSIRSSCSAGIV